MATPGPTPAPAAAAPAVAAPAGALAPAPAAAPPGAPVCKTAGCGKPTYNGKPGEKCSKSCGVVKPGPGGAPVCTTAGCGKPTYNGKPGEKCSKGCVVKPGAPVCTTAGCGKPTYNGKPGEKCSKGCVVKPGPGGALCANLKEDGTKCLAPLGKTRYCGECGKEQPDPEETCAMKCKIPGCGGDIAENANFCGKNGHMRPAILKAMKCPAIKTPACTGTIEKNKTFCGNCGEMRPGVEAPGDVPPTPMCPHCGEAPLAAPGSFCGQCGKAPDGGPAGPYPAPAPVPTPAPAKELCSNPHCARGPGGTRTPIEPGDYHLCSIECSDAVTH